ncbi:unnamed protein product [Rotaria sp. Silwood1]|nr:unnamed protein product [Rotaria sp. Silwood1]CAF1551570.1 unnamed protein product [Rotaria sp. Silwood1]CAF1567397.1 unnamed protein product [Rotaria sp. Silwood1]CAF3703155.1 unnamed protein product [Rotaria sp. Silwood1]CAF4648672.1 unnamed protein product [Rotaria sp. Silwood1]
MSLYSGLTRDGQRIVFNPSNIHRESTVLTPMLIRFFSRNAHDNQDQNFKKLKQECIKYIVMLMKNHDKSSEAVDLLKYISMILRQFYFPIDENDRRIENETTKFISTNLSKFQYVQSARIHCLDMLNALIRCNEHSRMNWSI